RASLLGIVGGDEAGGKIRDLAREAGINSWLVADADLPTTLKMRVLGRQQQLLRVDFEQEPGQQSLSKLEAQAKQLIAQHDMLVLSDYAKGALAQVEVLINAARDAGVPGLVDPKAHLYQR